MGALTVPVQLGAAGVAFIVLGALAVAVADEDAFPIDPLQVSGGLIVLAGVALLLASAAVAFWRRRHPQPS